MGRAKPHQVLAHGLCALVLCTYLFLAVRYPVAYIWATYEDLVGEWIQFWSLFAAFVLSAKLALGPGRFRLIFGMLTLSCLYVAMEEISWGQRLFGFASPAFFKAHNLQGETNLHNFLTGPYSTALKAGITYVLAAGLAAYGALYPIALRLRWRPAVRLDARGLPAPPLYLSAFFVGGAVLETSPFGFNEAEVAEILVGLALTLTTVHYLFCRGRGCEPHAGGDWPAGASGALTRRMATAVGVVLVLSVAMTAAVYSSESGRKRILKRIDNGVEKFAGRYMRHKHWDVAIDLYERVLKKKPTSISTRRSLADCYLNAGDPARHDAYLKEALAIDLKRYRKDPQRASVNRSLVRTYRMLGELAKADEHLKLALQIGLKRIAEHPDSANAAYSLGKTYTLTGRHAEAFEQYARACKLKPSSKKFRKAYYIARKLVR